MTSPITKYWIEAKLAVKDRQTIGFGVWYIAPTGGRTCVRTYSVNRRGGNHTALILAMNLRDTLNRESES
jgi:hypothetical protein